MKTLKRSTEIILEKLVESRPDTTRLRTKEIKAANILNNATSTTDPYGGGDGVAMLSTSHPTQNCNQSNTLSTAADLSETSLESMLIQIADMKDDRGLRIAAQGTMLIIPTAYSFTAERLLESQLRTGTADNDINAIKNMGMVPEGYFVNHYLNDTDAFFLITDVPNGMKHFDRAPLKTSMEGDFDTGNVRYKARERYVFGASDWRGIFGAPGA